MEIGENVFIWMSVIPSTSLWLLALHKFHMADGQNRHDQTVSERRSKHVLYALHLISVEVWTKVATMTE